ncbi:MFS transporter [Sphingomonas lycopersici]|uniref:MFS transporter n=1 Tax=Sphingomonas lycopersici TaxID=2951807 RepID=A0AA42CSY4_9SPHN|nr:MFS transporter [Sphingomonas lycopersici]MCW6533826.1 MFS transporter [Sphingomonas lycopersici]
MAALVPVVDPSALPRGPVRITLYSWVVFALSFGLLISDYMARQVLNAVFPLLKAEWALSDTQLGWLSGVVALMVGLLTFPLSLAADRWGRVRSLAVMAAMWSLATLLCAAAANYGQMLIGRLMVGVGEAAYGSVGIAVVISVFPSRLRATLSAAFMAGGLFGQVLGVAVGGEISASHGWRVAFLVIGLSGLALALGYALIVRERLIASIAGPAAAPAGRGSLSLRALFAGRCVKQVYVASGVQLFVAGALPAWLPSYFNRYYDLPVNAASRLAALLLLACGCGMILCGMASDRLTMTRPDSKFRLAIAYSLGSATALTLALLLPAGPAQIALLAVAMFLVAGTTGPAGAMVANLTPLAIHGTAFATLTLAHNLLGLAPGPIVTGWLADAIGLHDAFRVLPFASVLAAWMFFRARRTYSADLAALETGRVPG